MNVATPPNQAVSRSPLVVYLMLWITLGFYGIFWYLRAVEFLNSVDQENSQDTRKIKLFVFVFLAIYISGFTFLYTQQFLDPLRSDLAASEMIFVVLFLMALSWNVLVPAVLVRLATRLRRVQSEHRVASAASPWRTLLAYFLWFASFPYLQHHLNRIAEIKTDA